MNTTSAISAAPKLCDGTSVGVDVTDATGRHLLQRRVKYPPGFAPIAGHGDEHPNPIEAIRTEAREELGITLTGLVVLIDDRPLANACRRIPIPGGPLHRWTVFGAHTDQTPVSNSEETAEPGWYTTAQLQQLADQTIAVGQGAVGLPVGLEPAWVLLYAALGTITVSPAALATATRMAAWLPPNPGEPNLNHA